MPTAAALTGAAELGLALFGFAGAAVLGYLGGTWLAHRTDRAAVTAAVAGQATAEAARQAACLDRDNALLLAGGIRARYDTAQLEVARLQTANDTYAGQYVELYRQFAAEMRNYGVDINGSSLTPHPSPITNPHGFTKWWRSLTGAQ